MNNNELFNENNEATYCPEDDKLRLYIGRVPRDEYEALRKEGWTSTAKQGCDFVAVWTPDREDTAISYAGIILDEDQGPEDRAADRAERFGGYLDKRREEAHGFADRYDSGPSVHGYQDWAKAVRAADRHDRLADKACDAWSKAEYWHRRTAGVISHALYTSLPSVRMGRIKKIEAEQRKHVKSWEEATNKKQVEYDIYCGIAGKREKILMPDGWQYTATYHEIKGEGEEGRLTVEQMRLIAALAVVPWRSEEMEWLKAGTVTPQAVALDWLEKHPNRPEDWKPETSRFFKHCELRLAYENQMLEASGGRAGELDIIPGGWLLGYQVHKVNKSRQTGRVVSASVMAPVGSYFFKDGRKTRGDGSEKMELCSIRVERLAPGSYRAPTPEELEEFTRKTAEAKKVAKATKSKAPSLINPTREAAEALQATFNEKANKDYGERHRKDYSSEVFEMTQAQYKARSGGSYSLADTVFIGPDYLPTYKQYYGNVKEGAAFKVRVFNGECYYARRVIIITDKPQKALPARVEKAEEVKA